MIKELFKYKDLWLMLVKRDIRIRYKQAAMGFLWAIFMPIVAVSAGVLIKKAMSIVSGTPLDFAGVVSISIKVLPWTFFLSAIRFSVQSLIGNTNLVTKIYFPKAVLPLASITACMFDFFIAVSVLTVILTIAQIGISYYLLLLPITIVFLFCFTAGLGLFLAASNVFFRDVKYIVEVVLMFGIFFTPVLYNASVFGKWGVLLMINPVGCILETINTIVVLKQLPNIFWLSYAGVVSITIFFAGLQYFHKQQPYFAENI